MDISALLATGTSGSGSSGSSSSQKEDGQEVPGNKRGGLYKKKGDRLDKRALRQIQDDERRKASRNQKQLQVRGEMSPSKENEEIQTSHLETTLAKDKADGSRREKLAEYLKKKQQIENKQRREAKPAFKAGTYKDLNPLVPGAAPKPSAFSLNTSSVDTTTRQNTRMNLTRQNTGLSLTRQKTGMNLTRQNTTIRTGAGTASRSTSRKTTVASSTSTRSTRAASRMVEKQEVPIISVDPPIKSSSESSVESPKSSTSSGISSINILSFAPPSFAFDFKKSTSLDSVSEDPGGLVSSTPCRVGPAQPLVLRSKTLSSVSEIEDEVFSDNKEETELCEEEVVKNNVEEASEVYAVNIPLPETPAVPDREDGSGHSPSVPAREDGRGQSSKERSPCQSVEGSSISSEEGSQTLRDEDSAPTPGDRGRRRSRRRSGVLPDSSLSQEELSLTPARRVKERSVSKERRKSACRMCPEGEGDHQHAATPRISRASTLPSLEETSPSDESQDEEGRSSRTRSKRGQEEGVGRSVATPLQVRRSSRRSVVGGDKTEEEEKKAGDDIVGTSQATPMTGLSEILGEASLGSVGKPKQEVFKTPSRRTTRKVGGEELVPEMVANWVTTSRGSSKRKKGGDRLSLSDQPKRSSIVSLFEDLDSSPLLATLERKAKSAEDITDEDFLEEDQPKAKMMKLDMEQLSGKLETSTSALQSPVEAKDEGKAQELEIVSSSAEEPVRDVPYFRHLIESETERLTALCDSWETKLDQLEDSVPEEIKGSVRSVVGQGRLVMKERFGQFSGLVDDCELGRGERETTTTDLTGFWEMIYFQVEDVDKKFSKLTDVENNGWKEPEVVKPKKIKKPLTKKPMAVSAKKAVGASSGLKDMIAARRQLASEGQNDVKVDKRSAVREMIAKKKAELAKQKEAAAEEAKETVPKTVEINVPMTENEGEEKTFDGGFFAVKSPVCSPKTNSPARCSSSPRSQATKSTGGDRLRRSVLTESARRVSGMLVSPFVSHIGKRAVSSENSPATYTTSPQKDSRRSSLFDNMDVEDNVVVEPMEVVAGQETKHDVESGNLVVEQTSRTYSRSGSPVISPAREQRRKEEAFDSLLSGPSTTSPAPLSPSYFTPALVTTPAPIKNAWSTSSEEGSQEGVRFTPGIKDEEKTGGTPGTPHPKSGHKLSVSRQAGEVSPGLRKVRLSLMPMAESDLDQQEKEKSQSEELISFDSPVKNRRQSTRTKTPRKKFDI